MSTLPPYPIAFAHNRYRATSPSGENVVVDREFDLLRDAGAEVCLVERRSDDLLRQGRLSQLRTLWSMTPSAARQQSLSEELPNRPGILHLHNPWPQMTPDLLVAAKRAGWNTVMTLHNYRMVWSGSRFLVPGRRRKARTQQEREDTAQMPAVIANPIQRFLYERAIAKHWRHGTLELVDRFLCLSEPHRELLVRYGIPEDKLVVKPHFLTDPGINPESSGDQGYALFVGRCTPEKGIGWLVEHWPFKDMPLVVAGSGPLAEVARQRGADVRGQVSPAEVFEFIRNCRMVVVPSTCREPFGLANIEALACGKPILTTSISALAGPLDASACGACYDPDDSTGMIEAARRLWHQAPELRSACRKLYETSYTPQVGLKETLTIYQKVRPWPDRPMAEATSA